VPNPHNHHHHDHGADGATAVNIHASPTGGALSKSRGIAGVPTSTSANVAEALSSVAGKLASAIPPTPFSPSGGRSGSAAAAAGGSRAPTTAGHARDDSVVYHRDGFDMPAGALSPSVAAAAAARRGMSSTGNHDDTDPLYAGMEGPAAVAPHIAAAVGQKPVVPLVDRPEVTVGAGWTGFAAATTISASSPRVAVLQATVRAASRSASEVTPGVASPPGAIVPIGLAHGGPAPVVAPPLTTSLPADPATKALFLNDTASSASATAATTASTGMPPLRPPTVVTEGGRRLSVQQQHLQQQQQQLHSPSSAPPAAAATAAVRPMQQLQQQPGRLVSEDARRHDDDDAL
jgi:hypothetical protein